MRLPWEVIKINTLKLKGKIVENNTTLEAVAKSIKMDRSTFYRKIKNNGETFTLGEMYKIVDVLSLSQQETIDIFLKENSHYCE